MRAAPAAVRLGKVAELVIPFGPEAVTLAAKWRDKRRAKRAAREAGGCEY